ncbi:response regulator [Candidatus Magnetomonas plexicatena]|nr:response regulator [Nitrospirales bacterium LBB_01]
MMPIILIADDEQHIRMLIEQTLEALEDDGVEILTAENGAEALEIVKEKHPELVFLDVMMPKMNGFDVCNTIKNVLGIKGVYIIMLTAKGQEFDKEKGIESGCDEYVTKPFSPRELKNKAKEVLGLT